jgi:hypothetical protein
LGFNHNAPQKEEDRMKRLVIFWLLLGILCGGLVMIGWKEAGNQPKRACQPSKRRPEKRRPRLQKYLVQDERPIYQNAGQEIS